MTREVETVTFVDSQLEWFLQTDDLLDNASYKWCEDDVFADEKTFNQMDIKPRDYIAPGTRVVMKHLWGWGNDGVGPVADYEMLSTREGKSAAVAVWEILSRYHAEMKLANREGRFYFIEQVTQHDDGVVEIIWGT